MTAFAYCKPVIATNVGGLLKLLMSNLNLIELRSVNSLLIQFCFCIKTVYNTKNKWRGICGKIMRKREKVGNMEVQLLLLAIEKQYEEQFNLDIGKFTPLFGHIYLFMPKLNWGKLIYI